MLRASGVPGFGTLAPQARRAQFEDASRSWWRWILAAVAAVALAWWFFGPTKVAKQTETMPVKQTETTPAPVVRNYSVDGVDLKSSLESALAGLKANLQGVSDAGSANGVLPQLQKGAAEFDKIRELAPKLPTDSKSALAALVAAARPTLDELFNKVLAIPGVSDIAKPAIDALRTKLDALSKA